MNPDRNKLRLEELEIKKDSLSPFSSLSTTLVGKSLLKLLKDLAASSHKNIIDDLSNKIEIKVIDLRYWVGMADAFNKIHDIIIEADDKLSKIDDEILILRQRIKGDSDEQ